MQEKHNKYKSPDELIEFSDCPVPKGRGLWKAEMLLGNSRPGQVELVFLD